MWLYLGASTMAWPPADVGRYPYHPVSWPDSPPGEYRGFGIVNGSFHPGRWQASVRPFMPPWHIRYFNCTQKPLALSYQFAGGGQNARDNTALNTTVIPRKVNIRGYFMFCCGTLSFISEYFLQSAESKRSHCCTCRQWRDFAQWRKPPLAAVLLVMVMTNDHHGAFPRFSSF